MKSDIECISSTISQHFIKIQREYNNKINVIRNYLIKLQVNQQLINNFINFNFILTSFFLEIRWFATSTSKYTTPASS